MCREVDTWRGTERERDERYTDEERERREEKEEWKARRRERQWKKRRNRKQRLRWGHSWWRNRMEAGSNAYRDCLKRGSPASVSSHEGERALGLWLPLGSPHAVVSYSGSPTDWLQIPQVEETSHIETPERGEDVRRQGKAAWVIRGRRAREPAPICSLKATALKIPQNPLWCCPGSFVLNSKPMIKVDQSLLSGCRLRWGSSSKILWVQLRSSPLSKVIDQKQHKQEKIQCFTSLRSGRTRGDGRPTSGEWANDPASGVLFWWLRD